MMLTFFPRRDNSAHQFAQELGDVLAAQTLPGLAVEFLHPDIDPVAALETFVNDRLAEAKLVLKTQAVVFAVGEKADAIEAVPIEGSWRYRSMTARRAAG